MGVPISARIAACPEGASRTVISLTLRKRYYSYVRCRPRDCSLTSGNTKIIIL